MHQQCKTWLMLNVLDNYFVRKGIKCYVMYILGNFHNSLRMCVCIFSMKPPYKIALSQVARAVHALGLQVSDLMGDDHRDVEGKIAQVAEVVLRENNDRSRRVMKSFVKRYSGKIYSSLINIQKENHIEFPGHIEKIAANLLLLSKDPEMITKSGWRTVNSIFGDLCQLEKISKRKEANRKKMYNLWINKDGLLRTCYDSLVLKSTLQDDDEKCAMESCSSSASSESEDEVEDRKTHPVGFTGCVIKVGTCKVDGPLLTLMEASNESLNLCVKEMIESLCPGCVVNLNRVNHNKCDSPRITGYAYCSHKTCRLYKFTISLTKGNSAEFELFGDKMAMRHKGKMTRSLKGLERNIEKEALANTHPYTHRLNSVNNCDVDLAIKGNLQSVRKGHVFRKVRSEYLAKDDHHKDDIMDLMLMMDTPDYANYIQSVGKPFHAYLWCTNMHKVAHKVCKKGAPNNYLYFDATGSVVKSQKGKPVYLYGGSFASGGEIYPAFDFLLSSHKTDDISLPLISYRRSVLDTTGRWPLFPLVVMDDSMAMRSALSLAWNSMPLDRYISCAYEWMKDGIAPLDMVVIQGCISHFSKRVCQGATKFAEKGSTLRKFMIESFISLCQMKNFDSMLQGFRHICVIFHSEFRSTLLRISLVSLQATVRGNEVKEEDFKPGEDEEIDTEQLWEGSPLAIHLKEIVRQELEHVKAQTDDITEKNPYFCPDWFNYMLKTFAPKLVFNSAIFLADDKISISNQLQENSHRILKVVLLKNERKKKPGRFVKLQKKRAFGLIKLHDLRLGRKPLIKNKSLVSYEEKFKKRLRNKTAHTNLKAVKKIDLSLISSKAKKKKLVVKPVLNTRKRGSPWKFNLSDEEDEKDAKKPPAAKVKKTAPAQSPPNHGTSVGDLLAEWGSDDYPPFWQTTQRYFLNSEVNITTLTYIVNNDWLDDESINAFLHTRLALSADHPTKFLLFNTFHTGYIKGGLGFSAKAFIRKMRPCGYDVWLIPSNVSSNHWALFVVLPRQKVVLYVDSLNMSATSEFKSVTAIIQYSLQVNDEEASLEDWVGIKCTDIVQQNNASDCGVFVCLFAHVITSGVELNLHGDDGKIGRIWLVWELCCAEEPTKPVLATWDQVGKLAKDELPVSLMEVKRWDKKTSSMKILSQIMARCLENSFRDEMV